MPRLNLNFQHSVSDIAELLIAMHPLFATPGELLELSLPPVAERHAYQNADARSLLLRVVDACTRAGIAPAVFTAASSLLLATALCADGALPGFEIVEDVDGVLSVVPMARPQGATLQ